MTEFGYHQLARTCKRKKFNCSLLTGCDEFKSHIREIKWNKLNLVFIDTSVHLLCYMFYREHKGLYKCSVMKHII